MTETGWQAIGRVAKERRERLGLNQDELAQYGGPKVATVGKFERAAQSNFPLRTQHQVENALGWPRGTIEQFVAAIDEGDTDMDSWEYELVNENIPDLSEPREGAGSSEVDDREVAQAIEALAAVVRLLEPSRLADAVHDGLMAMLPHLSVKGAAELGRSLRDEYPPEGGDGHAKAIAGGSAPTKQDYELIAHDEEHSIEDEQGHDETP